jgi:hypothetical protein
MTDRERFAKIMRFEKGLDRFLCVEWAPWWDKTIERWEAEGLPKGMSCDDTARYFGLTPMPCAGPNPRKQGFPSERGYGLGVIDNIEDYERLRPLLFPEESIAEYRDWIRGIRERDTGGNVIVRYWADGFFWFPRTLLGIEPHLYAFYDQPELLHRINSDLCDFIVKCVDAIWGEYPPDLAGIAEDMSYNHGPMLSEELFNEFLRPYYLRVTAAMKKYGVPVFVDSDGDVTRMLPWLIDVGVDGIYPLERQAGVDILALREAYPRLLMLGGFDKMSMNKGEEAMRAEFERILPVMKSGGYLNGVDHQTPPGVSLENYRVYLRLLREYAVRAVKEI